MRLWLGAIGGLLVFLSLVVPRFVPEVAGLGIFGGVIGALVILVWWLFFSRARWADRLGAVVLIVVALAATSRLVHESVSNGMMGIMPFIFGLPLLCLVLVVTQRRLLFLGGVVLACGLMTLVRTGGITGDAAHDLHWRWTETPEDRLLAASAIEPAAPIREPIAVPPVSEPQPPSASPGTIEISGSRVSDQKPAIKWPGFRGPARDSVVPGLQVETNWSQTPPVELWRRRIGPGWSSFAVRGDLVYTQEQRGEEEIVASYSLKTGEPVWRHRDPVRFWESNAGAGPRGTPTLHGDRVYTFGATGIVNALDADSGALVWSRNAAADTGETIPDWGFASSPLVVDDLVIVAASGRLVAYEVATGQPRWMGSQEGGGYSSPHLVTIDGVRQIVLLRGSRTTSVAPADGTTLWENESPAGVSILQPAIVGASDILVAAGDGMGGSGIRRISVTRGSEGWTTSERWSSRSLKPYFNDFVVHKGHAFGFDGSILACIDLEDGARKWKGGRFGHGQLVLLPDQDMLFVLSEDGELALVKAAFDQFTEVARFEAIQGKTWNHPVLVGDVVLVRNGEEMAAFRLRRVTERP